MNRIDQIKAEQEKLADELESEMLKERANVLAKMKEDIKLFGFKASGFKGTLATRKKRGTVIISFLTEIGSRVHAAIANRCFGVTPPKAMFGRS